MEVNLTKNANRFGGQQYVKLYDRFRPLPPQQLIDEILLSYKQGIAPILLDLGCGSGLSSYVWRNHVSQLICVDPGVDMLNAAKKKFQNLSGVSFIQAFGHEIPVEAQSVDIVTCSQSFHWMDPTSTLSEVNRILKSGGVFSVFDCLWPPKIDEIWEEEYRKLFDGIMQITNSLETPIMHFWNKSDHQKNIEHSGYFHSIERVVHETHLQIDKESFIGLAESQGGVQGLRKIGLSDDEMGWTEFIHFINASSQNEARIGKLLHDCLICQK